MAYAQSKLQIWVNIVAVFVGVVVVVVFSFFPSPLSSSALKLGQAGPSHGGSFAKVPPLLRTWPISMARSKTD